MFVESFTDRNIQESRSFNWNCNLQVLDGRRPNRMKSYFVQVTLIVSFAKNVVIELPIKIAPKDQLRMPIIIRRSGDVQSKMTQVHTTNMPDPVMKAYSTVAVQPESSSSCRRANTPSCRYS